MLFKRAVYRKNFLGCISFFLLIFYPVRVFLLLSTLPLSRSLPLQ